MKRIFIICENHEIILRYLQKAQAQKKEEIYLIKNDFEDKKGHSCISCIGNCCTFVSNSMMITPLEAFDILSFLKLNPSFCKTKLTETLQQNIKEFRLHQTDIGIRKTYTCPFYTGQEKGCLISKHNKPYGCLGFLPTSNINIGKNCYSDSQLLNKRNIKFKKHENILNKSLIDSCNLSWKNSIPLALLDIIKEENKFSFLINLYIYIDQNLMLLPLLLTRFSNNFRWFSDLY